MQLEIMAVPVLYALFMVIVSTLATLLFRANLTVERKIPRTGFSEGLSAGTGCGHCGAPFWKAAVETRAFSAIERAAGPACRCSSDTRHGA
jgi:hypothetical protein